MTDISIPREQLLVEALRKCKTCNLPTEVRDLVNAALTQQAEPAKAYDLSEARGLIDWTKERDFNHIKPPHKWVLQVDQELRRLIAHIAAAQAVDEVDAAALRVVSQALNALVGECIKGAPSKGALMKARAMLPPYCEHALSKEHAPATQPAVNESVAVRALRIAHCHIDMDALRISHCKDAAAIEGAIAAWNRRSHQERALVADAERYRFLRNRALDGDEEEMPCIRAADNDPSYWALKGEAADAAIDAARGVSIPDGGGAS